MNCRACGDFFTKRVSENGLTIARFRALRIWCCRGLLPSYWFMATSGIARLKTPCHDAGANVEVWQLKLPPTSIGMALP